MPRTYHVPTLRTGDLAYYDSFAGLLPVKVLSIEGTSGRASTGQKVRVKFTGRTGNCGYGKGSTIETSGLHVAPRKAIRRTKYQTYIRFYNVEVS